MDKLCKNNYKYIKGGEIMTKQELMDFRMEVERLYNEYLEKTENRNISYGEIAYIQDLSIEELQDMYKELLESEEN